MLAKPSEGEGIEVLAPAWLAVVLSLLPSRTVHEGPPDCKTQSLKSLHALYFLGNQTSQNMKNVLTKETDASDARARMSAQETTPRHEHSRAALMRSTTSNPRADLKLGAACFSLCILGLSSSKIEASHP